jgi:ABC-2 type transport system permease protein
VRRTVRLVARRDLLEGLRSRAVRASLVFQVLLVVGIALVSSLTSGDDGPKTGTVGITGASAQPIVDAARARQRAFNVKLKVRRFGSEVSARSAVKAGKVDLAVSGGRLLLPHDANSSLVALLQTAARQTHAATTLRDAGLPPPRVAAALEPRALATVQVGQPDDAGGEGLAFLGSLLLYVAVMMCGYGIAAGIVAEKSSRVVEIILSAIRPNELLAGKVIGVGLLGLLQIAVVLVAGLAVALATGNADLPSTTAQTSVLVAIYFLLGYAFFGLAFAACASLVSRQEDIGSVTTPLLILLIGGYILSTSALQNPEGPLAVVLTFVPPTAPLVVPGRAAQSALPAWQLVTSIGIMALSVAGMVRLAARIYTRSVLRFGTPIKVWDALRVR